MNALKTIIHVHTDYSHDSNWSCEQLVEAAQRTGVHRVAITDHNLITGALQARTLAGPRIIVGEEISTTDGHIIGLFLEERVPPGLSGEQTARLIRAQGGLVLAPHPFATLCEDSLGRAALERLLPWLDAIEIYNSQNLFTWDDARARRYAARNGLTPYVGADAHVRGHLDGAHQFLPPFDGPREFLRALSQAQLVPRRFRLTYFAAMGIRHIWGKVSQRHLGNFGVNAPDSHEADWHTDQPSTSQPPGQVASD